MKHLGKFLAGFLFLLFTLLWSSQGTWAAQTSTDLLEEITVIGKKSLRSYKKTLIAAELKYYERFNAFNEDKKFDITCRKTAPIGSLILQRQCLPNFVIAAIAEENRRRLRNIGGPSVEVDLKKNQAILFEKMESLTKDNPELLAALYHLS